MLSSSRLNRWLNERSAAQSFLLVVVILAAVYVPTATWSGTLNVDAEAAAVPAWRLATAGNLHLETLSWNPWYVSTGQHIVSNRPPGTILWAVPWYLLSGKNDAPPVWPATGAALAATLLAMGILHLVLRRISTPALALFSALAFGLGTATWPVSSDQLWSHGPGQMWIALGMLALAADRSLVSGLALGVGVLTRPPIAFFAAGTGIVWGRLRRSWRRLSWFAAGSLIGLGALLIYNRLAFESFSVSGGYPTTFLDRLLTLSLVDYMANVAGAFVDPSNGLLIWSPFLILLTPGLCSAWRVAPPWARSMAIGGLTYFLLHLRMNRFSGGMPFDYRYPLEALVALAPLLLLSYTQWLRERKLLHRAFLAALLLAIVAQGLVATSLHCVPHDAGEAICRFF